VDDDVYKDIRDKSDAEIEQFFRTNLGDPNRRLRNGACFLHAFACERINVRFIGILVSMGADVNVQIEGSGETPLHCAARNGIIEAIMALISNNADTTIKECNGETPIQWALRHGKMDAVKALLPYETDVNAKNHNGLSLLRYLIIQPGIEETTKIEIAGLLIEKGADIYGYVNKQTLFMCLRENGYTELERFFQGVFSEYEKTLSDPIYAKFKENIETNPNDASLFHQRGLEFMNKELYDLAIVDFSRCIEIDPAFEDGIYNKALTFGFMGEWDSSIAEYDHAIIINQDDWRSYYGRGFCHFRKGRNNLAKQDLEKVVSLNPNDEKCLINVKGVLNTIYEQEHINDANENKRQGMDFLAQGLFDKAIEVFTRAISLCPNDLEVFRFRAVALSQKGEVYRLDNNLSRAIEEYDRAILDFTHILNHNSQDAEVYHLRGCLYSFKKEYDIAINDLSEAIRLEHTKYLYYLSRGSTYNMMGENEKAKQDLKTVLQMNPDNKSLSIALELLRSMESIPPESSKSRKALILVLIAIVILCFSLILVKVGARLGSNTKDKVANVTPRTATTTTNVRFRAKPSTEAEIISTLSKGEIVTVTDETKDGWTPVSYKGNNGWISREYLLFDTNSTSTQTPNGSVSGLIFFDKGEYSDGWRYLEAAPARCEFTAEWGLAGVVCPINSTEIGSGYSNTASLIKLLTANGETDCAAQLCAILTINGFNDWFLPSRDELNEMYKKLRVGSNTGGFNISGNYPSGWYWSSSSHFWDNAEYISEAWTWAQRFSDGSQEMQGYDGSNRPQELIVRAIRRF